MTTTPILGLPLLATQQSQPNVSHNEAITILAALLYGVIDMTTTAPPGSPSEGDSYIIAAAPTGAWAGRAYSFTVFTSGGWRFLPGNDSNGTPIVMGADQEGLQIYNKDDATNYQWDGAAWNAI